MLHAFGHHVVMCCDIKGVVGSNFQMVIFEPTLTNMLQHVTTGWLNRHNMSQQTMLQYVVLACCDHLAGDLRSIELQPVLNWNPRYTIVIC